MPCPACRQPFFGMASPTSALRERKSPRLGGFDYSSRRWYFVTACALDRAPYFGALGPRGIRLSRAGEVVEEEWHHSASLRTDVVLDAFVVMPDHVHGLVGLINNSPGVARSSLTGLLGTFKAAVTRRVHRLYPGKYGGLWQRSFHDSIIRSHRHLENVRAYIHANPRKAWDAMIAARRSDHGRHA